VFVLSSLQLGSILFDNLIAAQKENVGDLQNE